MEEKKSVKIEVNWTTLWIVGWMFTWGITYTPKDFNVMLALGFWEKILVLIISYFTWPLVLGMHFAK